MANHKEIDPSNFPAGYVEALIEKYGGVVSLHSEDLGDFGTVEDTRPDEELDDFEYYGRHGFSRNAPTCDDPECPCAND